MAGHIGTSDKLDWCTPTWVRDATRQAFQGAITLDPADNPNSIMGAQNRYRLPEHDGLVEPWDIQGDETTVFVNPPWGKAYMKPDRSDIIGAKSFQKLTEAEQAQYSVHTNISDWVAKAVMEWRSRAVQTIMLLPAATDTKHWQGEHGIFQTAMAVCWVRGRIRFLLPSGQPGGPAPNACALVYWGFGPSSFKAAFETRGFLQRIPVSL